MTARHILFLYGPPGSGKTTVGRALAHNLGLPFYDLDAEIEANSGMSIPAIFETEGEARFRQRELDALRDILTRLNENAASRAIVALGGGALTQPELRQLVEESGAAALLTAPYAVLLERLQSAQQDALAGISAAPRPLLQGDLPGRLAALLERRADHYAAFPLSIDTGSLSAEETAWMLQVRLGWHRVKGMGQAYDVVVQEEGLVYLGEALRARGLRGPLALVSDEHVAALYAETAFHSLASAGYAVSILTVPAGEAYKTMDTVQSLWAGFLSAGVERLSTVVALGGGVIGDLTGFAAATYLRGVGWVSLPTTLLAMVDASLGGKTGADLPQGKNLVGAFHPPALVLADPTSLSSLPEGELRSGMAEVIKHGVIADPGLFELAGSTARADLEQIVRRAMAVKVCVIEADPYERGLRAALNLGHTVGHAVEKVSDYRLRHGEAVSIGMVAEARLAERLGIAQGGLAETIAAALAEAGLPTAIPAGMDRRAVARAMQVDKKKAAGVVRFALPRKIGEVVTGVEVDDFAWLEAV
jgi:shikimate kinase / 3-dehydroquinate synthase